ncbi:hypothetical protein FBGL_08495 [Flavobacterium glycines]|uniref:Uncharacterized protein n=1 Tax=Flavobacterium glycines TaxID=551990 RepID=A0A1B9DNM6_9FLAO|nr:hypothetical protein FBGL_08495 [Flavobacterium glycines]
MNFCNLFNTTAFVFNPISKNNNPIDNEIFLFRDVFVMLINYVFKLYYQVILLFSIKKNDG